MSATAKAPRAIVKIGEQDANEEVALQFTPMALRVLPKVVEISVGKAGLGRARVFILDNEYERRNFYFSLSGEGPFNGKGTRWSETQLYGATLTKAGLDNLIEALTVARAEAAKQGMFTERPTPTAKSA